MPLECASLVSIQFRIKGLEEKKKKHCTCPGSIIAFDMINHLMNVILRVLLFLINHHAWIHIAVLTLVRSLVIM